ncbi:predicted protein [Sclerotinia sclerotiorum 1980 UF-70]|uniref:Uncharacterized protein n=1 Tax=Sclerotinia sclerotiorum (strain ATCC 18683 / 1980 / Ss-1) TaxID=665079 RepID=A7ESX2_SCLS1|nr:predicted protein [Sclerotinia sclerotiorum 1980 UF-70]EDN92564.1 predicted protein [Sclerotinia sclerotiorum 1980 UF-70]
MGICRNVTISQSVDVVNRFYDAIDDGFREQEVRSKNVRKERKKEERKEGKK